MSNSGQEVCIVSPATGLLCEPGSPDSAQPEPQRMATCLRPVCGGSAEESANDPRVELGRPSLQPSEFIAVR